MRVGTSVAGEGWREPALVQIVGRENCHTTYTFLWGSTV